MAIEDYYKPMKLKRSTSSIDDIGGDVKAYADIDIDGLVTYASSSEIDLARRLSVDATHTFYCDTSIAISIADKVEWDGALYQVVTEPQNTVWRDHHYKTLVRKIVNG